MSDAITTSRATCGPVDQRRPVGSFRVENGISVFDGPDADMLRLRRAAGLLRRIGAGATTMTLPARPKRGR